MVDETSSEFDAEPDLARLLDGLDAQMPGPSPEFAESLLGELRDTIGSGDRSPLLSVRTDEIDTLEDDTVVHLHDLPGAEPNSPGGFRWLVAAAAVVVVCVAAGAYFISAAREPSVLASDPQTEESVAEPTVTFAPETAPLVDEPEEVVLDFSATLGFTEVSNSTIRATFTATDDTVFNATIRSGDELVSTQSGSAVSGEPVQLTFTALSTTTVYSVEVTLLGPPSVVSPRLEIRTGGDSTPIEISELTQTERTNTTVSLNFSTNLCGRWSAVVLDLADQTEVQRVDPDPDGGCRQDHEVVIGAETPLDPGTSYLVLVEAVAELVDGAESNLTSQSIEIQTEE